MSVSDRRRSRSALRAAAHRFGRDTGARRRRPQAPPETPRYLRRLPWVVFGSGEVVHIAGTFRSRLRGLLGTDELPSGHGLLLTNTRSVHMIGMRFAVDLVWLDAGGRAVLVDTDVRPGQQRRCRAAKAVLEVPVGESERFAAAVTEHGMAMMTRH